jgi:hypothetical protein
MVSELMSICAHDKIHCCRQTIRHQKAKVLIAARAREGGRRRRRRGAATATAAVLGGALYFLFLGIFWFAFCCNSSSEQQRQTEVKQMAHDAFSKGLPPPPLPFTPFLSLPAPPRPARSNKKKFQPLFSAETSPKKCPPAQARPTKLKFQAFENTIN